MKNKKEFIYIQGKVYPSIKFPVSSTHSEVSKNLSRFSFETRGKTANKHICLENTSGTKI